MSMHERADASEREPAWWETRLGDALSGRAEQPKRFVEQVLATLEVAQRETALCVLGDFAASRIVVPHLMHEPLSQLKKPTWGTWRFLMSAMRNAYSAAAGHDQRTGTPQLSPHLEEFFTDRLAPSHGLEPLCDLLELHNINPARIKLHEGLFGFPAQLRNRIAHDPPTPEWWERAAGALVPVVEGHLERHPLTKLVRGVTRRAPWFLERDGATFSFTGMRGQVGRYSCLDKESVSDADAYPEICRSIATMLGHDEVQRQQFEALMDSLAEATGFLLNDFLVGAVAGKGGSSIVHEARQLSTGRRVAIKVLQALDEASRLRFEREALLLGDIEHPNIVQVLAFGHGIPIEPEGCALSGTGEIAKLFQGYKSQKALWFTALEWIEGETLATALQREVPTATKIEWFAQAAAGLAAAHERKIVHRDVSPANIMIRTISDTDRTFVRGPDAVKIIDFGLGRPERVDVSLTVAETFDGTARYAAPERFASVVDPRHRMEDLDVYGLCATFYQAFVGSPPFAGSDTLDVISARKRSGEVPPIPSRGIPRNIRVLLRAGLDPDPTARPGVDERARMQNLEADLRRHQQRHAIEFKRGTWRPMVSWVVRHWIGLSVAMLIMASIATITLMYVVGVIGQRDRADAARDETGRALASVLEEQGREQLAANRPRRAAVLLAAAYRAAPPRPTLRLALADAMGAVEVHSIALGSGAGHVSEARISDDASVAATVHDGIVSIWSTDGRLLRTITSSSTEGLVAVAFGPSARLVAVLDRTGHVTVHELATGNVVERHETSLPALKDNIMDEIRFTPDGEGVYVVSDVPNRQQVEAWTRGASSSVKWSDATVRGRLVLTSGRFEAPPTASLVRDVLTGEVRYSPLGTAGFSADGQTLIAEGLEGTYLLRAQDGVRVGLVPPGCTVNDVLLAPHGVKDHAYGTPWRTLEKCIDGHSVIGDAAGHVLISNGLLVIIESVVAAGGERPKILLQSRGWVRVLDAGTLETIVDLDSSGAEIGNGLDLSSDGTQLVTHGDTAARLWSLPPAREIGLPVATPAAWAVVSRDGSRLGSVSPRGEINVVSTVTHSSEFSGTFAMDASQKWAVDDLWRTLVVTNADHDGSVTVETLGDISSRTTLGRPEAEVLSVLVAGRQILFGGKDGHVWRAGLGNDVELRHVAKYAADVTSVSIDTQETRVVVSAVDGMLAVLEAATFKEICRLQFEVPGTEHRNAGSLAVFSPRGDRIAVARNHTVALVDPITCTIQRRLDGHARQVSAIVFSPDGRLLASKSIEEKSVRVWNIATGVSQEITAWDESPTLQFSHDGRMLSIGQFVVDSETLAPLIGPEGLVLGFDRNDHQLIEATATRFALRPLRYETRSPDDIDAIIGAAVPWRLVEGHLQDRTDISSPITPTTR